MKQRLSNCQKTAEQALVYFDEEIITRMQSTIELIDAIEKNPQTVKLNSLKRKLMLENLQKIQAREGVIREDIVAALEDGADFNEVQKKLMAMGKIEEDYASENEYGDEYGGQEQISEDEYGQEGNEEVQKKI